MKTIVLCIDRDDDLGRSTGIRGPVYGVERNLEAAKRLGLRDPEDTDVNALFAAVKTARELRLEVVTITGDRNVGLVSDRKVGEQLDKVMEKLKPDSVILVTDGLDDEQVIPIIQSRVKIDSVQRVIVRQSRELEKAYFKAGHYLKEITEEPALARLIFGVPGIALILLAIGGIHALNLIIGLIGGYLILRGFGYEEEFFQNVTDFIASLSIEKISTFIYFIAFMAFFVSISYAYGDLQSYSISLTHPSTSLTTIAMLILYSKAVTYFIWSIIIAVLARTIDDWGRKQFIQVRRYLILIAFIILVKFIMDSGARFLLEQNYSLGPLIRNGIVGILVFWVWTRITELWFKAEIDLIKDIIRDIRGLKVYNKAGKELGNVTKVIVEDLKLKTFKVGRKYFKIDEIDTKDNTIILNT